MSHFTTVSSLKFQSVLDICLVNARQVDDKLPDILKDSTKSREISISLTNLNYGGQLAEQLLAFSKQMELCYKRLSELQKGKPADKDLRKYLNYVDSKKNWFKQAQARDFLPLSFPEVFLGVLVSCVPRLLPLASNQA